MDISYIIIFVYDFNSKQPIFGNYETLEKTKIFFFKQKLYNFKGDIR